MFCENCGNHEANFKYTQIINGVKKQMNLCNKCASEMGLNNISFGMPMDMFNYMENIFSDNIFEPQLSMPKMLIDDVFEDEFETFRPRINTRYIHEPNAVEGELDNLVYKINKDQKQDKKLKKEIEKKENKTDTKEEMKLKLQHRLEQEIKEERYEDAAKTRDEIKKLDK